MKNLVLRLVRDEEGQALAEYGLILGLIAVVVITLVATLGDKIAGVFTAINTELP